MLHASVLAANAHSARDDADRSKRALVNCHTSPLFKRRAAALEEAASRMELEAKAALLQRWRGRGAAPAWEPRIAAVLQVSYVERRHVLRQLNVAPVRPLPAAVGPPSAPERVVDWALLSHLGAGREGGSAPSALSCH